MPTLLARVFLPLNVLGSLLLFEYARRVGWPIETLLLVSGVVTFTLAFGMERRWPFRPDWNRSHNDVVTDLTSAGVFLVLLDPLMKGLTPLMVVAVYGLLGAPVQWFATGVPLWAQVGLAALVAEFLFYWSHRLHHQLKPLWWLHALHHGSERLYALNNFRIHPLNHLINTLMGMLPLMVLGAPPEVLLGYLALIQPILLLQHANLDLRSGWFNYLFSTNEVHRWHHSSERAEADSNFGRGLIVWDHLFGTFRYSRTGNMPNSIGLFSNSRYPASASYFRQVVSMFGVGCCR